MQKTVDFGSQSSNSGIGNRFSVVAAIFLPLTFVTDMLGMNVAGLPGLENPYGFIISAVVMAIFGIGLVIFFKWKKWI